MSDRSESLRGPNTGGTARKTLAFICTANMCRSIMAHAIAAHELAENPRDIEIYSAGTMALTGFPIDETTRLVCCKHGAEPPKDSATYVADLPLAAISFFVVMERAHAQSLIADFGIPPARVKLLGDFDSRNRGEETDDPVGSGPDEIDRSFSRIRDCVRDCLATI